MKNIFIIFSICLIGSKLGFSQKSVDTFQIFDANVIQTSEEFVKLSYAELEDLQMKGLEILRKGNYYYWNNNQNNAIYCDGDVYPGKYIITNTTESFCLACYNKNKIFLIQACIKI